MKYFDKKELEGGLPAGEAGYTIIEMMIAISVFLVVVMTGMNALLNAGVLHRKSQDLRSIMDNLSFIMEDMSRNLRTGNNYHCFSALDSIPSSTSSLVSTPKSSPVVNDKGINCWGISFEPPTGNPADHDDQWVYYISAGKVFKSTDGPYVASSFNQLTPDEVEIDSISGFTVLGAESPSNGDTQQPLVTIRLVGSITYKDSVTPFSLQTSMSQRLIDI